VILSRCGETSPFEDHADSRTVGTELVVVSGPLHLGCLDAFLEGHGAVPLVCVN
jgi:hypothetical protein